MLDKPTINQYWNSSKVHLLNHELASIYITGAQHNVTLSDNGRTKDWRGQQPEKEKERKRSEAA